MSRHHQRIVARREMNLFDIEKMIYSAACTIYKRRTLSQRTFVACFGVTDSVLAKCWILINEAALVRSQEISCRDLLWTCMFLKQYSSEDVLAATCGVTQKTFRMHTRKVMNAMNSCYKDVVSVHFICYLTIFLLIIILIQYNIR